MTREELKEKIADIINSIYNSDFDTWIVTNLVLEVIEEYNKPKGKSIEERQNDFVQLMKPLTKDYSRRMLNEFFSHWTERSPTHKKMRFEKEKSFDISKRLITWSKRDKKWNDGTTSKTERASNW